LGYGGVVDFAAAAAEPIFAGSRTLSPAGISSTFTNSSMTFPAADLVVGTAGNINNVVRVAITAATLPGNYAVSIAITDKDLATSGDQAGAYVLQYVVTDPAAVAAGPSTIGIVAGPKLKTATITLSAAAGKLVTVTIEKVSTGKTFTYYRKANASGVATFTIRRVGTWEVFAAYGDDVTETVKLKK
jgi:hypothetical protein